MNPLESIADDGNDPGRLRRRSVLIRGVQGLVGLMAADGIIRAEEPVSRPASQRSGEKLTTKNKKSKIDGNGAKVDAAEAESPEFDGKRAFDHLKKICEIGPRISGSNGMQEQQRVISEHFSQLNAKVRFQSFDAPHPQTRRPVPMNNLIITWHPERKERILLCCHYDTRPLPDRDPNPNQAQRGTFIGANDGASGAALLMELGRHISKIETRFGVDFVLFDGEELVYHPNDPYFLGSEYFARSYRDEPPAHRYHYGVLFDMVAGKDLRVFQEVNSWQYARSIVQSFWKTAADLKVKEFVAKRKHDVRDDHLSLNQIARIPTIDIIDFDYDAWHTTRDVPSSCSAASLGKVGKVTLAWIQDLPDPPEAR